MNNLNGIKDVEKLFEEVGKIINENREEKINNKSFNVFQILNINEKEVCMCKILAELLNPQGLHNQKDTYLKLFIKEFLPNIKINTKKVKITTEETTYCLNDKEKRRMDIIINEVQGYYIPIEVKINAFEQDEQCSDYLIQVEKYYQNNKINHKPLLCFLTKDGYLPKTIKKQDADIIKCISWNEIVVWLDKCVSEVNGIKESSIIILQLKQAIKMFLEREDKMDKAIRELLLKSKDNFNIAEKIAENIEDARIELLHNFVETIENKLKDNPEFEEDKYNKTADYKRIAYQKEKVQPEEVNENQYIYRVIAFEQKQLQLLEATYELLENNELLYKAEKNKKNREKKNITEYMANNNNGQFFDDEKIKECVNYLLNCN